jgi:hypothetical protein
VITGACHFYLWSRAGYLSRRNCLDSTRLRDDTKRYTTSRCNEKKKKLDWGFQKLHMARQLSVRHALYISDPATCVGRVFSLPRGFSLTGFFFFFFFILSGSPGGLLFRVGYRNFNTCFHTTSQILLFLKFIFDPLKQHKD